MAGVGIQKYRPSNATEGLGFMDPWCRLCARDRAMREGEPVEECDDTERCDIIVRTMAYKVTDPEYPDAWRYTERGPICAAFVPVGDAIPTPRCDRTIDMFDESGQ